MNNMLMEQSRVAAPAEVAGASPGLEPVPAKSPYRKYLVLVALHMANSDDASLLCEATDCSERTLHYVKNRLRDHDGVVFNHDRCARRYFVLETGVLDLPKVVDWVRRLYPNRFAYIKQLGEMAADGQEQAAVQGAADPAGADPASGV